MVTYLVEQLQKFATRIVVSEDGNRISAACLIEDIQACSGYWEKTLTGAGHHIGLLGENSYQWLVSFLGIVGSGNVAVALNHNLPDEDLRRQAELSDTEILLCDTGSVQEYEALMPSIPIMEMEKVRKEGAGRLKELQEDRTAVILFSSGTSGRSKPVCLSAGNFMPYGRQCLNETGGETTLMPLPFYHIGGLYCYYELVKGNLLVISSGKYMFRDIRRENITRAFFVPSMVKLFLRQLDRGEFEPEMIRKIRNVVSLGAPLAGADEDQLTKMGIRLETFYGLTETAGLLSGPGGAYRRGSSGKCMPYVEIRIEDGEIIVRGKNVMSGYYRMEEETDRILKDGWLYTGDLGHIDEEGYVYINGRKKNVILLPNGENVSPEDVEKRLYQCAWITECRVYEEKGAINVDIYSRQIVDGDQPEAVKERILDYIRGVNQTAHPMHRIKGIRILGYELEKTSTGKIKREATGIPF